MLSLFSGGEISNITPSPYNEGIILKVLSLNTVMLARWNETLGRNNPAHLSCWGFIVEYCYSLKSAFLSRRLICVGSTLSKGRIKGMEGEGRGRGQGGWDGGGAALYPLPVSHVLSLFSNKKYQICLHRTRAYPLHFDLKLKLVTFSNISGSL